jgi:hypothetical protein
MTRSRAAEPTTAAVQKWFFRPVVKNSVPTVGTPLNVAAFGMPLGALSSGLDAVAASRADVQ